MLYNNQDKAKIDYLNILYNNDNYDKDGLSEDYQFVKEKCESVINKDKTDNYFSEEDYARLKSIYGINLFDTLVERKLVK
jgi:hypothetical protein